MHPQTHCSSRRSGTTSNLGKEQGGKDEGRGRDEKGGRQHPPPTRTYTHTMPPLTHHRPSMAAIGTAGGSIISVPSARLDLGTGPSAISSSGGLWVLPSPWQQNWSSAFRNTNRVPNRTSAVERVRLIDRQAHVARRLVGGNTGSNNSTALTQIHNKQ